MASGAPLHVLLAEDNSNDVEMFRVCLERARILNDFNLVSFVKVSIKDNEILLVQFTIPALKRKFCICKIRIFLNQ